MLINNEDLQNEHVQFVSYTGEAPNLCSGILTLKIEGKDEVFGVDYSKPDWRETEKKNHPKFWESGGSAGSAGFSGGGYTHSYVNDGEWIIDAKKIPEQYQKYASEIDRVFNENVRHGCCGGCL